MSGPLGETRARPAAGVGRGHGGEPRYWHGLEHPSSLDLSHPPVEWTLPPPQGPEQSLVGHLAVVARALSRSTSWPRARWRSRWIFCTSGSADLPPDPKVVAYCRGPWCVLSFEAVARLREAGFAARRLQDGLPEWRRAGLPV